MPLPCLSSCVKVHCCSLNGNSDEFYIGRLLFEDDSRCLSVEEASGRRICMPLSSLILEPEDSAEGVVYVRLKDGADDAYYAYVFKEREDADKFTNFLFQRAVAVASPKLHIKNVSKDNVVSYLLILKDATTEPFKPAQSHYELLSGFLTNSFLNSLWQLEASAREPTATDFAIQIAELIVRIINLGSQVAQVAITSYDHSHVEAYLYHYFQIKPAASLDALIERDFLEDEKSVRTVARLRLRDHSDDENKGGDPLAILLSDTHIEGCLHALEASPQGRADFTFYWKHTVNYVGDDVLVRIVKDQQVQTLIRMALVLASRIMYLRDVVLPRYLEDQVIQRATMAATALHAFIWWSIELHGGVEVLVDIAADEDPSLIQILVNIQRNLKTLALDELKRMFKPLFTAKFISLLWRVLERGGRDIEEDEGQVARHAVELLYSCMAMNAELISSLCVPMMPQIWKVLLNLPKQPRLNALIGGQLCEIARALFTSSNDQRIADLCLAHLKDLLDLILEPTETDLVMTRHLLGVKALLLSLLRDTAHAHPAAYASALADIHMKSTTQSSFTTLLAQTAFYYYTNAKALELGVVANTFMSQAIKYVRFIELENPGGQFSLAIETLLHALKPSPLHGSGSAIEGAILSLMRLLQFKSTKCTSTLTSLKHLIHRNRELVTELNAHYGCGSRRLTLFKEWLALVKTTTPGNQMAKRPPQRLSASSPSIKRLRNDDSLMSMLGGTSVDDESPRSYSSSTPEDVFVLQKPLSQRPSLKSAQAKMRFQWLEPMHVPLEYMDKWYTEQPAKKRSEKFGTKISTLLLADLDDYQPKQPKRTTKVSSPILLESNALDEAPKPQRREARCQKAKCGGCAVCVKDNRSTQSVWSPDTRSFVETPSKPKLRFRKLAEALKVAEVPSDRRVLKPSPTGFSLFDSQVPSSSFRPAYKKSKDRLNALLIDHVMSGEAEELPQSPSQKLPVADTSLDETQQCVNEAEGSPARPDVIPYPPLLNCETNVGTAMEGLIIRKEKVVFALRAPQHHHWKDIEKQIHLRDDFDP